MAWIRVFTWRRRRHESEAHAYQGLGSFRSACELSQGLDDANRTAAGPLCPACRAIVANVGFGLLEQIGEMEAQPAPAAAVPA